MAGTVSGFTVVCVDRSTFSAWQKCYLALIETCQEPHNCQYLKKLADLNQTWALFNQTWWLQWLQFCSSTESRTPPPLEKCSSQPASEHASSRGRYEAGWAHKAEWDMELHAWYCSDGHVTFGPNDPLSNYSSSLELQYGLKYMDPSIEYTLDDTLPSNFFGQVTSLHTSATGALPCWWRKSDMYSFLSRSWAPSFGAGKNIG